VRRFLLAFAIGIGGVASVVAPAWGRDFAQTARDIVPSGQYGAVPQPDGALKQAKMYDALTPLFNRVSASQMNRFFKPMTIGVATPGPTSTEKVPRAGVRIVRDAYHIPHVFGKTRDDVTWGAGWVEAEDRGLLLQQARYNSLVAAIDAPGLSALGLIAGLQNFQPSKQTLNEVDKQTNALLAAGKRGGAVLHDIDVYLKGINAYFKAMGSTAPPFTRTDIYGLNALKSQFVGQGGGDEPIRAEFLSALRQRLGSKKGWKVFNDLRELKDPETPSSVPGHVQFQPPPKSTSGNVIIDSGSLSASAAEAIDAARADRAHASNALLVSGSRSANHHPIMVAGPQIGYFYPGLTLEMDLNGPGINQRGATAAPFPGYIFIGRGLDSAWSLTSAGLDQIDTYVETLCGHSIHRYTFKGKCRAMQFFDAGSLNGKEVTFYRTVHGPVVGYAHVHGRKVALSRKRASYGKDVDDLLFYHDLSHGKVHNIHQFFKAACLTPQTFNSFYVDDKDIGVFTSGLVPIRPSNVDQGLPIDGRGKEEWHGDVPCRDHPQGFDPADGQIVNWNNRTQAGYQAPDDNWSLGAVQRVSLLLNNLGHGGHLTPQRVVAAMNAAATQDVREITFEPVLSKLLRTGPAPSKRAAKMLGLLDAWHAHGGSRLDRKGNGKITDPGAAIMDKAWPLLANAWASSVLGSKLSAQFARFTSQFDQPPGGQYTGWHIYMQKDLRTLLGERVRGKFAVRYCGAGNLRRCRHELWGAIQKAGNELAAKQGADPSAWRASATDERITFVPGLLKISPTSSIPYTMRYTNRPSGIQEVVSFTGHAPQDTGRGQPKPKPKPKPKPTPPPPPVGLG
jgi:acyl-homoserine lactone acylase PvdQ